MLEVGKGLGAWSSSLSRLSRFMVGDSYSSNQQAGNHIFQCSTWNLARFKLCTDSTFLGKNGPRFCTHSMHTVLPKQPLLFATHIFPPTKPGVNTFPFHLAVMWGLGATKWAAKSGQTLYMSTRPHRFSNKCVQKFKRAPLSLLKMTHKIVIFE